MTSSRRLRLYGQGAIQVTQADADWALEQANAAPELLRKPGVGSLLACLHAIQDELDERGITADVTLRGKDDDSKIIRFHGRN